MLGFIFIFDNLTIIFNYRLKATAKSQELYAKRYPLGKAKDFNKSLYLIQNPFNEHFNSTEY